jgi:hypothetical protein
MLLMRSLAFRRWVVAILGTTLPLVTGCGTSARYLNAVHPQYGQTEFDRDWYECRRENTGPVSSGYVYGYAQVAGSDSRLVVNEEMARQCLAARGWRPVTSSSSQTPPTPAPRMSDASTALQTPSAPADEKARTERFQRFARGQLAKPHFQAPPACDDGGWWAVKNYIVDVAPWVEATGLRKGDRLLSFSGVSLASYDTAGEAWSKVLRGDNVIVRIDRGGNEFSILIPCRDNTQAWQAGVSLLRAIADGQWQSCIDGVRDYAQLTRVTSASMLRVAWECMRERGKAARQPLPDEYWRTFHAWATKAIEESHYKPSGLTEIRTSLLDAADVLEKAGRSTWANDIRQQIATFETSSRDPSR